MLEMLSVLLVCVFIGTVPPSVNARDCNNYLKQFYDNPEIAQCGVVFDEKKCEGSPIAVNASIASFNSHKHRISSIFVRAGCVLTAFTETQFEGEREFFGAKPDADVLRNEKDLKKKKLVDKIKSVTCKCYSERAVPVIVPECPKITCTLEYPKTNRMFKLNHHSFVADDPNSCGVLYQKKGCEGRAIHLKSDETRVEFDNKNAELSSVLVNPYCKLIIYDEPYQTGNQFVIDARYRNYADLTQHFTDKTKSTSFANHVLSAACYCNTPLSTSTVAPSKAITPDSK